MYIKISSLYLIFIVICSGCTTQSVLNEASQNLPQVASKSHKFALSSHSFLTEQELFQEAGFEDIEEYNKSIQILGDWLSKPKERYSQNELLKDCKAILKKSRFTLTESSLKCVGLWVEKKYGKFDSLDSRSSLKKKSSKKFQAPKNYDMWLSFKGKSFRQAFSSIKRLDYKDFQNVVKYSLKTSGKCAFTNSHLALITHGESFLSDSDAFDYMKLIYHSTKNCIGKQKDENASRTHLRIGLLYLLEGELKEAKKAFLKSSKIRNSSEHFRALFWLGLLHAELDEETAFNYEGNIYWRRLLTFYPYTLHSIIVSRALGRDPLMNIVDKNKIMYLRNRVSKSFGSDDIKAFVFELLHSR